MAIALLIILVSGVFIVLEKVRAAVPNDPTDLNAVYLSDSATSLWWTDNSADEDGFRIYRSQEGLGEVLIAEIGVDSAYFYDESVSADTYYTYFVTAYNIDGESGRATSIDVYTTPAAPTDLTVNVNVLSWNNNANYMDSVYVERQENDPSGSDDWEVIGSTLNNTYTDSSASEGVEYKYRVRAKKNARWSDYSETVAGNWTFTNVFTPEITPSIEAFAGHEMEMDSYGGGHVVLCDDYTASLYYAYSRDAQGSWYYTRIIDTNNSSCDFKYDLEIDPVTAIPSVFLIDLNQSTGLYELKHLYLSEVIGDWQEDVVLSDVSVNADIDFEIDSMGYASFVVTDFPSGTDQAILYYYHALSDAVDSDFDSISFIVTENVETSVNVSLAYDAIDQASIAYVYDNALTLNNHLNYMECAVDCLNELAWTSEELLWAGVNGELELLYDGFNDCQHIIYENDSQTLRHTQNCGGSFSDSLVRLDGDLDLPWDAEIDTASGNIHLLYHNLNSPKYTEYTGSWSANEDIIQNNHYFYDFALSGNEPIVLAIDYKYNSAFLEYATDVWTTEYRIFYREKLGAYSSLVLEGDYPYVAYTTKQWTPTGYYEYLKTSIVSDLVTTEVLDTFQTPNGYDNVEVSMANRCSNGTVQDDIQLAARVSLNSGDYIIKYYDQTLGAWNAGETVETMASGWGAANYDYLDMALDSSCSPVIAYAAGDSTLKVADYDVGWNVGVVDSLGAIPRGISLETDSSDNYYLGYIDTAGAIGSKLQFQQYDQLAWSDIGGPQENIHSHFDLDLLLTDDDYPAYFHDNDDNESSNVGWAFYESATWHKQDKFENSSDYSSDVDKITSINVGGAWYVLYKNLYDTLSVSVDSPEGGYYFQDVYVGEISSSSVQDVEADLSGGVYVVAEDSGNLVAGYYAPAPFAPFLLAATSTTTTTISLAWQDQAYNESGFQLYRTEDSVNWTLVATLGVDVESYTDTDLTPNTSYSYRIRAFNDNGVSDFYTTTGMRTRAVVPETPNLSSPANSTSDIELQPTFEFSTSITTGTAKYKLELSDSSDFKTTIATFDQGQNGLGWEQLQGYSSGETASFTLPDGLSLASNSTYYWRVQAYAENGGLSSEKSTVYSFTTINSSPEEENDIDFVDYLLSMIKIDNNNSETILSRGTAKMNADLSFGLGEVSIGGLNTTDIVSFDFDGDGDLDLAEISTADTTLQVYENEGAGVYGLRALMDATTESDLDVVDYDMDGDLDLIKIAQDGRVRAYENNDGVFSETTLISATVGDFIDVGDIDRDGDPDFLIGNYPYTSTIYLNDGDGNYNEISSNPYSLIGNDATRDVALVDVNQDGYLDLLNSISDAQSYILISDQATSFTRSAQFSSGTTYGLIVFDADNDGDVDVVEGKSVYLNDGTGNFIENQDFSNIPYGFGDFNNDGFNDLVMYAPGSQSINIYLNEGTGDFIESSEVFFDSDIEINVVEVGDFNNDGLLDIYLGRDGQNIMLFNETVLLFEEDSLMPGESIVAVFDSDNDGDQDLYGWQHSNRVIYVNNGEQDYSETIIGVAATGASIYDVATVDVDGDGDLDIIEAIRGAANQLFINNGNNSFTKVNDAFGVDVNYSVDVEVEDLDNDGDLDVVFMNVDTFVADEYMEIWLNDGTGDFDMSATSIVLPSEPVGGGFDLGDVDIDGNLDLIVPIDGDIYVFAGDGSGDGNGFVNMGAIEDSLDIYSRVAKFGDFNNDGELDVFTGSGFLGQSGGSDFVILNFEFPLGYGASVAEVVDIDNDGDLDIIGGTESGDENDSVNFILRNVGSWSFIFESDWFVQNDPTRTIAVGDYDSDGDMDFFTRNAEYYGVNYRYTQKQSYSTEDSSTIQSTAIDTTDDDIYVATLMAREYKPSGTAISYYLSSGSNNSGYQWLEYDVGTSEDLYSIGVGEGDGEDEFAVFTGGANGNLAITFNSGSSWDLNTEFTGPYNDLVYAQLDVNDSGLFVVSDDGVVWATGGGDEVLYPCNGLTTENLNVVKYLDDNGHVYIGGENSTLLDINLDTLTCQEINVSPDIDINDINVQCHGSGCGDATMNIWAVGDGGTIINSQDTGENWSVYNLVEDDLLGFVTYDESLIFVGAGGAAYVAGEEGLVDLGLGVTANLNDIHKVYKSKSATYDYWIVGDNGTILFSQDGETWVDASGDISDDLNAVYAYDDGSDDGIVFVVGDSGAVYQYNGYSEGEPAWEGPINNESEHIFNTTGSDLKWKAVMTTDDGNETPLVYEVVVNYSTTPRSVDSGNSVGGNPPTSPSDQIADVLSTGAIQWNFEDTADNEEGYKLYDEDYLLIESIATQNLEYITETGLEPNTEYSRYVTAYNSQGESSYVSLGSIYTLAKVPAIQSLSVTGNTSLGLSIDANGNPSNTEYAIYETSTGKWLQADNKLGTARVYKTYSAWLGSSAKIPVLNLTNNAMYTFKVIARNGDGIETDYSTSESIIVYKPAGASVLLNKKVGVNLDQNLVGVYFGQPVMAGTYTAEKLKALPLIDSWTDFYIACASFLMLLFFVLLVLNAHPGGNHVIHVKKILFDDFRGKRANHLFHLLHGRSAAMHGQVFRNHHRFYKMTSLGMLGVVAGLVLKVMAILVTFGIVYGTLNVHAFENQSGVEVYEGDVLTYQIEYTNNGGETATDIKISDIIPEEVSYIAGSLTDGENCTVGDILYCQIDSLSPDDSGVIEFSVKVNSNQAGNSVINIATAEFAEGTSRVSSNSVSNEIIVEADSIFTCEAGQACPYTLGEGWNFVRLVETSRVNFAHVGGNHSVTLNNSDAVLNRAQLTIASDPIQVDLGEGAEASVDSNGNGLEDLKVKVQDVESEDTAVVGILALAEVPVAPVCGDKKCNGAETCNTCPGDCGVCPVPPVCGDKKCNGAENCSSCPGDCGACVVPPVDNNKPENNGGAKTECSDTIDNDGDGLIDLNDPGCSNANDQDELDEEIIEEIIEDDQEKPDLEIEKQVPDILSSEKTNKVINTISTVVSGLTKKDYSEVKEEVKKQVGAVVLAAKKATDATINNPAVEKVNESVKEPVVAAVTAASVASVATVGFTGATGATLLTYLQFLFTQPLMLITRRRRRGWGVIYNSITKKPIDLAIIRLYNAETKKLVQTRVTDRLGRYQFIVKPGKYFVEVDKKEFKFPTEVLAGHEIDGDFNNLYSGGTIEITSDGVINWPIALDPDKQVKDAKQVVRLYLAKRWQNSLTLFGPVVAIVSFVITPETWIAVLVGIQIVLYFIFKRLAEAEKPVSFGVVKDKESARSLSRSVVRVFDTKFNKLLETQVTDRKGKYAFLVGNDQYYMTSERSGYSPHKTNVYDMGQEKTGYLAKDIHMSKEGTQTKDHDGDDAVAVRSELGRQEEKMQEGVQKVVRPRDEKFSGDIPEVELEDMHEDYYDVDVLRKD